VLKLAPGFTDDKFNVTGGADHLKMVGQQVVKPVQGGIGLTVSTDSADPIIAMGEFF
jgi:hypothetical protein